MANDNPLTNSQTIIEMFQGRVKATPDDIAYETETGSGWKKVSWRDYGELVAAAALGLKQLGINAEDCVAIWGDTMPEWTILDLGILATGAHVAGIYQTSTTEQAAYILNDSKSRAICVDSPARLKEALSVREETPTVEQYILWSGEAPEADAPVITLDQLIANGREALKADAKAYEEMVKAVKPDMYAILIYTSGTTGLPKGVILTHLNCVENCKRLFSTDMLQSGDTSMAFLPMSHVAEYTLFLGRIFGNITAYFCPDFTKLGDMIREKKPTLLIAVPRVHEKVYQKIMTAIENAPPRKQKLARWALEQGLEVAKLREQKKPVPPLLALKHRFADKLVLSKVRDNLGGNLRLLGSAAAPIDTDVIWFFLSCGFTFLEAYGLSESGGASHCNMPDDFKVGTVGKPIEGYKCKLAEDGEVLLGGPAIFKGYLNKPEETAEALDDEGWLHTGDIGEIDEDGFLRITDRKKNLIITAGGKNVAPAASELLIKRDAIVSQAVVLGDRKPYLVALVTISPETKEAEGLSDAQIEERVAKSIDEANKHLARYEQVKKFKILDHEFSVESGEMTPTMKIKRNVVAKNYADEVEAMYSDAANVAKQEKASASAS